MELQLHFSALVLLFGWFELLLMSGQLPLLSVKLELLKSVILTFLYFMVGYVLLLIAFFLGFNIPFKENLQQDGTVLYCNVL